MQTIMQQRKIEDEERKQPFLEIIADKYCRAILETTMTKPKPANEISYDCKIPISTVYRRLQTLHDNKFVGISGTITQEGKKHFLYKSKFKQISASINGGQIDIQVVPNILGE